MTELDTSGIWAQQAIPSGILVHLHKLVSVVLTTLGGTPEIGYTNVQFSLEDKYPDILTVIAVTVPQPYQPSPWTGHR
jgi:hypothetical protein